MGRRVWIVLAAFAGGLLAAEIALRVALFSDLARGRFWNLRQPKRYYDGRSEDEFWLLKRALARPGELRELDYVHEKLGWLEPSIDPVTYLPRAGLPDDGRRLVVLYGDSFARCMPEGMPCFETLLERSHLESSHVLLNYGVRGYGLDQVALLLESSLPALRERAPIVVVAVYVDEDLDRCLLRTRDVPKPRFVARAGTLELETTSVPTAAELFSRRGLPSTSYLARLVARAARDDAHEDEIREIAGGVLDRIAVTLRSAGVEAFFLLFHGERSAYAPCAGDWREALVLDRLRAHGTRRVSVRSSFAKRAALAPHADPFLRKGESAGHYGPLGNELAFVALVDGIEGRFDAP